jgi:hypothetical protein
MHKEIVAGVWGMGIKVVWTEFVVFYISGQNKSWDSDLCITFFSLGLAPSVCGFSSIKNVEFVPSVFQHYYNILFQILNGVVGNKQILRLLLSFWTPPKFGRHYRPRRVAKQMQ